MLRLEIAHNGVFFPGLEFAMEHGHLAMGEDVFV